MGISRGLCEENNGIKKKRRKYLSYLIEGMGGSRGTWWKKNNEGRRRSHSSYVGISDTVT